MGFQVTVTDLTQLSEIIRKEKNNQKCVLVVSNQFVRHL